MDRIFKFRAWVSDPEDIKDGTMYESSRVSIYQWPTVNVDGDVFDAGEEHGVFIMQYTGIVDKNGKEIYEGDIVRGNSWKEPHAMRTKKPAIGQVEHTDNYGFTFSTKDTHGNYRGLPTGCRTYPNLKNCEVVGNIYENPELLDDNK